MNLLLGIYLFMILSITACLHLKQYYKIIIHCVSVSTGQHTKVYLILLQKALPASIFFEMYQQVYLRDALKYRFAYRQDVAL